MLSRMVKALEFYPTCKLISQPATVSWMLAERARFLRQRQKMCYFTAQQTAWASWSCALLLSPGPLGHHKAVQKDAAHTVGCITAEETQAQGIPVFNKGCQVNLPELCPKRRLSLLYQGRKKKLPFAPEEGTIFIF